MASYYNIDSMHGNSLSEGIQSEIVARRAAQETANRLGEPVYLYEVGNGDGESEVESEEILPELPDDAVIVETMPEQHRESHRAAGNWGSYPGNGSVRKIMSREDAEELCSDDEDEYDHIVRDAEPSDAGKYEVA